MMLLLSLLRHCHHEKQVMDLKAPNVFKKLVKHSLYQNSFARPIFPSQSDRLDIEKYVYVSANILLILNFSL